MARALRSVIASGLLPATATRLSTSSSGDASANRIATASSVPGSVSMMIGRGIAVPSLWAEADDGSKTTPPRPVGG